MFFIKIFDYLSTVIPNTQLPIPLFKLTLFSKIPYQCLLSAKFSHTDYGPGVLFSLKLSPNYTQYSLGISAQSVEPIQKS